MRYNAVEMLSALDDALHNLANDVNDLDPATCSGDLLTCRDVSRSLQGHRPISVGDCEIVTSSVCQGPSSEEKEKITPTTPATHGKPVIKLI